MVMKIDMKKAYDRKEWTFLIQVLKAWDFSDHFQQLIYSCINSVTINLLLNGSVSEIFKPSRGLRQGNPFSPLLFFLESEVLSRFLGNEEVVDRNALSISHLLYADYLLVLARADKQEAEAFMKCFDTYHF